MPPYTLIRSKMAGINFSKFFRKRITSRAYKAMRWSSLSIFIPAINIWSLTAMAKGSIAIKNKRGHKGLIGHIFLHLSLGLPGFGSSVIRTPLKVGGSIPFWKYSENMYRKGCVNLVANFYRYLLEDHQAQELRQTSYYLLPLRFHPHSQLHPVLHCPPLEF